MSNINPKKINYNLEVLRGSAAVIVVFHHIIYHNLFFNPKYFPSTLKAFEPPGHLAVLIFFVLSGYVIGINHKERLFGSNILLYIKKRFIRIYPIYFLGILLGLMVSITLYSWPTMLSNFTLTQNVLYPVIWENNPAWSLNYEILYYLLFIPISLFRIKPASAFIIFFIIGTVNLYFPINPIVTAYSFGYCFWIMGVHIAWNFKEGKSKIKLLPILFYFLALENIISGSYIFRLLSLVKKPMPAVAEFWSQNIIGMDDLIFLPYCFMIILLLSGREFKYKNLFFICIQIFPLYVIFSQFKHHTHEAHHFFVGIGYLILCCLSYITTIPESFMEKLGVKLGGLSYGIYIIHFPILFLFGRITPFSNNLFYYILRVILYLFLTFLSAWFLENKFQPAVRRWLNTK